MLSREAQCRPVWKRKFIDTTDSKHYMPVADNILNRQFNLAHPDLSWVSDMTYPNPTRLVMSGFGDAFISTENCRLDAFTYDTHALDLAGIISGLPNAPART
ncbi:hypothetical protein [Glaciimonas immobilis]|uniref:Uncharacterized protein n=1 Tax=Glaciimonas immobilis TaxID=728004 RepID=A0A840RPG0_9BURK|nr:hypothetical protein HAV38_06175 [Glaciimonas immobilis]MBB5199022.1 hypothetical protein [Glaciimonas immobilis]